MTLADEIRHFICTHYIEKARKDGKDHIELVSGQVHSNMGLVDRMPAVCSALRSRELETLCNIQLVNEVRLTTVKKDSSTNKFVFAIKSHTL